MNQAISNRKTVPVKLARDHPVSVRQEQEASLSICTRLPYCTRAEARCLLGPYSSEKEHCSSCTIRI